MVFSRSPSCTPPRSYRKHRSDRKDRRSHRRSSRHRRHRRSVSTVSGSSSGCSSCYNRHRSPLPEKDRPVDPPPSTCLGVFGLSNYTQEADLRTVFGRFGLIEKVQIVYDAKTKASRGFGFVYFVNLEDASAAKVQCNGMVMHERTIRVDYSVTERPHTPTPGIYMGEREDRRRRKHRSSYSYRGRSYDDDYHHGRSRRSSSRSHRRHRRSRHRHHRRRRSHSRSYSRSRSWSNSSRD
ncbi:transformer-2 protein homolog beta-like [Culex pipiens pallens]|uniref:transformer-2 protein homolog beta-like n=1 Tax=Culex pipiens pallens TaxID=42434 RepID=UPI001954EEBE|nr:transformer-2 protein homolog beta-like [Culex pipiens pallens]